MLSAVQNRTSVRSGLILLVEPIYRADRPLREQSTRPASDTFRFFGLVMTLVLAKFFEFFLVFAVFDPISLIQLANKLHALGPIAAMVADCRDGSRAARSPYLTWILHVSSFTH